MIEVQKKYVLTGGSQAQIAAAGMLESEKMTPDTYYDKNDATFGLKEISLHQRLSGFQLSVVLYEKDEEGNRTSHSKDITDESEMREILGLPAVAEDEERDFEADLAAAEIVPQAHYITTRRKYKIHELEIEMDVTSFGYSIAKISNNVHSDEEVEAAMQEIEEFAMEHQLELLPQGGSKLAECLYRTNTPYYRLLVEGGILKEAEHSVEPDEVVEEVPEEPVAE